MDNILPERRYRFCLLLPPRPLNGESAGEVQYFSQGQDSYSNGIRILHVVHLVPSSMSHPLLDSTSILRWRWHATYYLVFWYRFAANSSERQFHIELFRTGTGEMKSEMWILMITFEFFASIFKESLLEERRAQLREWNASELFG